MWSQEVTRGSNALDLEPGVFTFDDPKEIALSEKFVSRLNMRAIAMDGTCTGEHGIGQGKIGFMRHELGHGVDIMRTIKQALDPQNIMNPGKILPAAG